MLFCATHAGVHAAHQIQGFCFLLATLLISRAQSNWGQEQWDDSSLHHSPASLAQKERKDGQGEEGVGRGSSTARCSLLLPRHAHKAPYFLSMSTSHGALFHRVVLFVR